MNIQHKQLSTLATKHNTRALVLTVLHHADEVGVDSHTRLQNLVFLTQQHADEDIAYDYPFVPFDYGPFSPSLQTDVETLVADGLVNETVVDRESNRRTYELTETGERVTNELCSSPDNPWGSESMQAVKHVVGMFNRAALTRVLEHVHNKYPEFATNSVL